MISSCSNINFDSCHWLLNPILITCKPLCSGLLENPCHSRDLASYLTSMLPSLWTMLQFWIYIWTSRPLLTPPESSESLEHTQNTQTRVWGRCSTWAEVSWCWMVHCTTQLEPRGVQTLASAHALCLTTLYSYLSISGAFWGLQGFWKCWKWSGSSEVNLEWEHRGQVWS